MNRWICPKCVNYYTLTIHMVKLFRSSHRIKSFTNISLTVISEMIQEQRTEAAIEEIFNCVLSIKTIFKSFLSPSENISRKMLQKYRHFLMSHFPLLFKLGDESRAFNSSVRFSPSEVAAIKADILVDYFSIQDRERFVGCIMEDRPGPSFSDDLCEYSIFHVILLISAFMSSTQNPSQPCTSSQILFSQSTSPVQPVSSTQPLTSSHPSLTLPASTSTGHSHSVLHYGSTLSLQAPVSSPQSLSPRSATSLPPVSSSRPISYSQQVLYSQSMSSGRVLRSRVVPPTDVSRKKWHSRLQ
ncbi:uncharacterized protein LOC123308104 isoform X1 [Coccinella septempunctata]|uniref:uncharacterized protein LOC123308104 isoform X1 n=1 Tax=Coccinella septempunctata TaxID=41139 RepID=UPI001D08EBCC|nr:uncharacterized protein LOC123308104 isoform X1 [Coccinella septempunctata]XP_044746584.1 uncharacterized protein LOC123308104 isoform X1 [Coccinella septempunctata]